MTQFAKCLLHMCEDLGLDPRTHINSQAQQHMPVIPVLGGVENN